MMNSEFGNVWGYNGSTGDVDYSWDYHRAVDAFRRHPALAGWLYTEHHDVINEWNGYWRFDRSWKETGLGEIVEGMTLRDLHAPVYIAVGDPDRDLHRVAVQFVGRSADGEFDDAADADGLSLLHGFGREERHDEAFGLLPDQFGRLAFRQELRSFDRDRNNPRNSIQGSEVQRRGHRRQQPDGFRALS